MEHPCSGSRAAPETLGTAGGPPCCRSDTRSVVALIQLWRLCSGPLGLPVPPLTELGAGCGEGVGCRRERRKEARFDVVVEADAKREQKEELQRLWGRQPVDSPPGSVPRGERDSVHKMYCDSVGSRSEPRRRGDLHLNASHLKKSLTLSLPPFSEPY